MEYICNTVSFPRSCFLYPSEISSVQTRIVLSEGLKSDYVRLEFDSHYRVSRFINTFADSCETLGKEIGPNTNVTGETWFVDEIQRKH